MTAFTARPVLSEYKSIGDQLRLARTEKAWTREQVARRLKVKVEYVQALEEEDYALLPGGIYGKIFLRQYADLLGLDRKTILKNFVKERQIYQTEDDDVFSKKVVKKHKLIIFPKVFRNLIILFVLCGCVLYLGFYLKKITAPPDLEILEPSGNEVRREMTVNIVGQTEPESDVSVNGQAILIDSAGAFSQNIALKKGVNIIIVKAKKKYSRERTVTRQILVE